MPGGRWAAYQPLRIATRGSALARWQAGHVAELLAAYGWSAEMVVVTTSGDERAQEPIEAIGVQGAFVREVQAAVLHARADLAVHSAKDLPSAPTPGLVIGAVPPRADPRDALVGARLAELGPGAVVATGSPRRRAQLAALRPDLSLIGLRGNIETRLGAVPPGGAVVVAAAALARLGLGERAAEVLDPAVMLPQVGQGALAVECRAGDRMLREALASIDDAPSRRAVECERAFLGEIGPGCTLPVAAHATPSASGAAVEGEPGPGRPGSGAVLPGLLRLEGLLASFDGQVVLRREATGHDPVELGSRLAAEMLDDGGRALVETYGR